MEVFAVKLDNKDVHMATIDQFLYRNDSAVLTSKRKDRINRLYLTRTRSFKAIPDTVKHIADNISHLGYYIIESRKVDDESGIYHWIKTRK